MQNSGVAANDDPENGLSSVWDAVGKAVEGAANHMGEIVEMFFNSHQRGQVPQPQNYTSAELSELTKQGTGWLEAADMGTTRRPRVAAQVAEVTESAETANTEVSTGTPESDMTTEPVNSLEGTTATPTTASLTTVAGGFETAELRAFNDRRPIYVICENNSWGSWSGAEWELNGQRSSIQEYCVNQGRKLLEIPAGAENISTWYQQGSWISYYNKESYTIAQTPERGKPFAVILGASSSVVRELPEPKTIEQFRTCYKQITNIIKQEGRTTYYRGEDAGKILTHLISSIQTTDGYKTEWGFATEVQNAGAAALAEVAPPRVPPVRNGEPSKDLNLPSQFFDGQVRRV